MSERFDDYRAVARSLDVDAVALVPGPNFERAFGRHFGTNERPLVVVVPASGAPAAVVPNLELSSFARIGLDGDVFDWRDQSGYQAAFDALLRHLPISSIAVEGQEMRVFVHHALKQARHDLRIVDGERAISDLRMIKSADELRRLEAAIAISERALARTIAQVRIGQSEKQVERMLSQALFEEGAEGLSFGPLVGAAQGSAMPHTHAREDYRLRDGDVLLIDFGARRAGFAADITRTFFVGHASDEARAVYETVLRANLAGHAAAKAGVSAHDVDDAVTGVLEASPYANRIRHKTGHGLGRAVHEAPYIMRGNHAPLRAGTVFTIEPGLYDLNSFGIRIEDDVVVEEGGCRSLTTFAKDVTVIAAAA